MDPSRLNHNPLFREEMKDLTAEDYEFALDDDNDQDVQDGGLNANILSSGSDTSKERTRRRRRRSHQMQQQQHSARRRSEDGGAMTRWV